MIAKDYCTYTTIFLHDNKSLRDHVGGAARRRGYAAAGGDPAGWLRDANALLAVI